MISWIKRKLLCDHEKLTLESYIEEYDVKEFVSAYTIRCERCSFKEHYFFNKSISKFKAEINIEIEFQFKKLEFSNRSVSRSLVILAMYVGYFIGMIIAALNFSFLFKVCVFPLSLLLYDLMRSKYNHKW